MLVKTLRLQRGWSQEHLAELVGVSARTIQRIERGFKPCFETSKALASIFEVDVAIFTSAISTSATHTLESSATDSTPADIEAAKRADEEAVARIYVKGIKEFYNHLITYLCISAAFSFLTIFHGMGDQEIIFFGLGFWGLGILIHGLVAFEKINLIGLGTDWETQAIAKKLGRKQ